MARFLIIDDNKETVDSYRHMLELNGHEVTCVATAKEGASTLANCKFDAVVLDLVLEDETIKQDSSSGLELVREISTRYPGLPTIAVTGIYEYMSDDWKDAFEHDKSLLPVHRFMEKPVDPSVLVYELEALIGHH